MTSQTISIDLIPQGVPPIIHVSQYDKGQTWIFNVLKGGDLFTIPVDSTVTIQGTKEDSTGFQYECTYDGSVVTAVEEQQMTVFAGDVPTELRITNDGDIIGTLNFIIRVEPAALRDDTIISETELPLVEEAIEIVELVPQIIAEMEDLKEDAEAWANGTRNGVPVASGDPAYEKNAKYYVDNFVGMVTDSQWSSLQAILSEEDSENLT